MNADLRKQLETLHGELAQTTRVDNESRELLVTLLEDISRLLESGSISTPPSEERSVTDRLDAMAVRFEADHPALGVAIRRVVDTLAKAGI